LTAEKKDGAAPDEISVSGNLCPRGAVYAKNEAANPKRMVTSTVRKSGGGVISVKTSNPVPKAQIFYVLSRLKGIEIAEPVAIGDVIIKNVVEGVDIVATQNARA